jgi:hypothetical protein
VFFKINEYKLCFSKFILFFNFIKVMIMIATKKQDEIKTIQNKTKRLDELLFNLF